MDLHGKKVVTVWAPEIHYVKDNYFIVLSMAPTGIAILKSATGKPQGAVFACVLTRQARDQGDRSHAVSG